jgi:hypothetical protein
MTLLRAIVVVLALALVDPRPGASSDERQLRLGTEAEGAGAAVFRGPSCPAVV